MEKYNAFLQLLFGRKNELLLGLERNFDGEGIKIFNEVLRNTPAYLKECPEADTSISGSLNHWRSFHHFLWEVI